MTKIIKNIVKKAKKSEKKAKKRLTNGPKTFIMVHEIEFNTMEYIL
tara:strand:- start:650 stop:787 length:138 start_codon:yes stop_codon:yes gene_type:complete